MDALTCRRVIDSLADYLDKSLEPRTREAFEAHIHRCDRCLTYLVQYGDTVRIAATSYGGVEAMPPARVRAVLERRKPRERQSPDWRFSPSLHCADREIGVPGPRSTSGAAPARRDRADGSKRPSLVPRHLHTLRRPSRAALCYLPRSLRSRL